VEYLVGKFTRHEELISVNILVQNLKGGNHVNMRILLKRVL
jgi:hypothetical protein